MQLGAASGLALGRGHRGGADATSGHADLPLSIVTVTFPRMIRGELAVGRGTSRHTLVFGGIHADPDHDAVMRIGGKAPRRQAHSLRRRASHACLGSPPPRIVMGISSSTGRPGHPISPKSSAPQWRLTLPDAGRRPPGPRRLSPAAKGRRAAYAPARQSWSCGWCRARLPSACGTIAPARFPSGT